MFSLTLGIGFLFALLITVSFNSFGQTVSIPREGFPYCEEFIGGVSNLKPQTVLGGTIGTIQKDPGSMLTGNSLILTSNNTKESGYAYIDIPFSPAYGIKVSFEYASYGGTNPGADGFSFFLFDGNYGDFPAGNPFEFKTGGFGGSLGYAPLRNPDAIPPANENGLTGAYLGIGFDEWGNFARSWEKLPKEQWLTNFYQFFDSEYGLKNNDDGFPVTELYPQTISVRGPENPPNPYVPYQLITHKEVNDADPSLPFPFTTDTDGSSASFNCPPDADYRKVFIDLKPNGAGTYTLTVKMNVGGNEITIFQDVDYPFVAPDNLKIGFAASTGSNTNKHEIRNLAADVSIIAESERPQSQSETYRTCIDEEIEIVFPVQLGHDAKSFIQCIQLFDSNPDINDPNGPWIVNNDTADHLSCGITDICNTCSNGELIIPTPKGTFEVIIEPLTNDNFNNLKDKVKIRFTPNPGVTGEASVFYSVTDNFGLASAPGVIKVIINPIPEIIGPPIIINPTCDGQSDGSILVNVGNLVDGATYRWFLNGQPLTADVPFASIVYGEAEVAFGNLNLGVYQLEVSNPLNDGKDEKCITLISEELKIEFEQGTPVEVESVNVFVCEGSNAVLKPSVPSQYFPDPANPPTFLWYTDPTRVGGPLSSNGTGQINGVNVTLSTELNGNFTISGLTSLSPTQDREYTLYVEAAPIAGFCSFLDVNDLIEVKIKVFPPLLIDFKSQPDWCRQGDGAIEIEALGGNGNKTFILKDENDLELQRQIAASSITFYSLLPGDYRVEIESSSPTCLESIPVTVQGPADDLFIKAVDESRSSCEQDNGKFEFEFGGGNDPLTASSITITGGPAIGPSLSGTIGTFTGLAPAVPYTITVTDAEGCTQSVSFTIEEVQLPVFSITGPSAACEDEAEVQFAVTYDFFEVQATAVPVFNWFTQETGGTPIASGSGPGGMSYAIDTATGMLTLTNLNPGTYVFWLEMTGPEACNLDRKQVGLIVNPLPDTDFEVEDALCFNGLGSITLTSGGQPGYTYTLSNGDTSMDGLFTDLPAGDYTIVVTNSFGCSQTLNRTIAQPDELRISNDNSTDPTCGAANGQISFDVLGGTKAYEITINGTPLTAANFDFTPSEDTYTITNLAPGTYSIAVIDGNSCAVEAANLFELVNNDGFQIDSQPIKSQLCEGGIALLVPDLTVPAGAIPQLDWYSDANATQQITSSASPAGDGFTYQITGAGELSISNLIEGTYTYYLKISGNNICEFITEATITVVAPIEATASATPVTCFDGDDGSITVDAPTGGSGTYEFSLNGTVWQAWPLFENLIAGTYTVFVRDDSGDNGCEIQLPNLEVESPAAPISENQGVELPVSCGLENGAVRDVLVTGGWGNYSFEWRKDNAVSGAILTQGTLSGIEDLAAGTYFLIVTDELGCVQIFEYEIGTASDPTYELIPPIDSCFGSPLEIRPIHLAPDPSAPPAAPTEIRWYKEANQVGLISSGPDSADPTIIYAVNDSDWLNPILEIENLPIGTHDFYFYVVCTGQEMPIQITVFDTPTAVFETEPVLCFGDSNGIIKSISGISSEYTYAVNGGSPISLAELEAMGFAAGTYDIQVITPAGCPQAISLEVEGPSGALEITALEEKDPSCGEENGEIQLQLSGGNPPYTLTMNGVEVIGFDLTQDGALVSFANLAGGTYQFELEDANNCSPASLNITLDPLEVPEFDASGAEICAFDPITGTANSAVLSPIILNHAGSSPTFAWYYLNASGNEIQINSGASVLGGIAQLNAAGELTLTGVTAAADPYTFYLEVTGDLVCPAPKIEVELKVNFTPEVVFTKTDILCFGEATGSIVAESGQLPGFSYSLSNGQTNGTGVFDDLPAGAYSIEVSNGTACIQTVQLTIEEPEQLDIFSVDFTDPTCDAINGEIIFEITGGVGAYAVTVNGQVLSTANFTFTVNSGTYTIQNLAPGSYSIAVTDENACTLTATDLFVLTNNPGIAIDSNPIFEEICEGQVAQLTPDLTVPAGVTPVIRWYRDAATTQQINSSPTAAPDGMIFQINAQGVLSITNLPAGVYTYYMRISGPGICTEVTVATVTVSERPEVVLDLSSISCFGENDGEISIISGHDPTYSYTLSNGQSNSTGNFTDLTPGSYTLEVENVAGCTQTLDFTITEPAELIIDDIDFINPNCDEENGQITLEINGGSPDFTILLNGQELNDTNFSVIQTGQQFQVKGLGPGVYSIQVTDQNGCTKEALSLFTLVNQPGIPIGSTPVSDEIMLGEVAVLTPDLTVPAGAVFDLIWYFDANATQAITSSPSPAANGVIYQIDGNDVLSIADLAPGTYTYYYEISGSGICITITEATVIVNSPLTADVVTTPVSCFGGNDGTILLENIVGGTDPLTFSLNQIDWQTSPLFENLPTGTYTLYVRDATVTTGALTSFPGIIITTTANPILANDPDLIRSSCDLPNGAIRNLQITGGTGIFTFEWRKNDPITGDLIPSGTLQGLEDQLPGNYFLLVKDSNGCEQIFDFEISELPDPVYEAVPPIAICLGETADIRPVFIAPNPPEPTAPTEVRWYKDAGQIGLITSGPDGQNPSISYIIDDSDWINPLLSVANLPVGVHDFYFFVVCTGQEIKVEVTVYEVPQLVFETTPINCFGDSNGEITAVSGNLIDYTYSVNGSPAITLTALESQSFAAGNYTIDVITPAGCSQPVSVTVEGPDSPLTIDNLISIDPECGADNGKIQAQITGGWAPYTINLSRGGSLVDTFTLANSNLDIDGLSIGIYTIGVVDARGCQITTGTIELKDGPTQILVDNQQICQGDAVTLVPTLDPPVSQFTILWFYDAAATQPIVSSPSPAADGRTYEISASGVLTISGLPASAAPYQYYASAVGPDVCVGFVARPEVRVNEVPVPSAVITSEQCFGEGGSITITNAGNSVGYQYSLEGIQFQSSNVFTIPQGNYSVTVRTPNGCLAVLDNLVVTGPPSPILAQVVNLTDATCGQNDGVLTLGITGGYGDYQVELIRNSIVVSTGTPAADGSVSFADLAVGAYSVLVRDAGNCETRFDQLVEVQDVPTPIIVNNDTICEGEIATLIPSTLISTPDLEFTWYFDELGTQQIRSGTVGNVTYDIASNGSMTIEGLAASNSPYSYFVMATGSGICRATPEKATVTVNAIPNLRVSNPSIVCDPTGTVDLTAFIEGFNPVVYDYNVVSPSGSAMRMNELTAVNLTGDYRVSSSLKGTTCWNQALRIRVIISPSLLVAEFNYLVDLGSGNIFQNESVPLGEDVFFNDITRGNAVLWNWDFGDGTVSNLQNPIHVYDQVGTYKVQLRVVDGIGCVSIYEMELTVKDDFEVIIPNAFTPGDVKNQYFKPEFRGIASMDFYIFNTWGELIYQTSSLEDRGWDGTLDGKLTPNGNYVYRGRFVSRGGKIIEKAGVFILIR